MKNLLYLLLALPMMGMTQFGIQDISKALGNGDVSTISSHFDNTIELTILDDGDLYNKSEASTALKQFFADHPPKSCSQVHQGSSKGKDSKYSIFSLNTAGESFRVFLYMTSVGGKDVIQELSIDKE